MAAAVPGALAAGRGICVRLLPRVTALQAGTAV